MSDNAGWKWEEKYFFIGCPHIKKKNNFYRRYIQRKNKIKKVADHGKGGVFGWITGLEVII